MSRHQPNRCLKSLRKIVGFTQERFAQKIGISYPYFLAIETGQRDITPAVARKIFLRFGVDQDSLLNRNGVPLRPRRFTSGEVSEEYTLSDFRNWTMGATPATAEFEDVHPQAEPPIRMMDRLLWVSKTRGLGELIEQEFYEWIGKAITEFPEIGADFLKLCTAPAESQSQTPREDPIRKTSEYRSNRKLSECTADVAAEIYETIQKQAPGNGIHDMPRVKLMGAAMTALGHAGEVLGVTKLETLPYFPNELLREIASGISTEVESERGTQAAATPKKTSKAAGERSRKK